MIDRQNKLKDHLRVQVKRTFVFIPFASIVYLKGFGNYTIVVTATDQYIVSKTMAYLGALVQNQRSLVRVSKQYTINFLYVASVSESFDLFYMNSFDVEQVVVKVSRRKKTEVAQQWIEFQLSQTKKQL